jgi:DNA polymerase-3 subunit epsilon
VVFARNLALIEVMAASVTEKQVSSPHPALSRSNAERETEEEAELSRSWKKLVKLYHPDRFANQPDKLETYHKLTAAINRAKDAGDIQTLREIAEDPHGFILRQGWTTLDFSDGVELAQLRRLYETL